MSGGKRRSAGKTVRACPECGSREIRAQGVVQDPRRDPHRHKRTWVCDECDHHFKNPGVRANHKGATAESMVAKLARADPNTPWNAIRSQDQENEQGGDGE